MSDQREGGSIGGMYHSAADRSSAGVNSFDTALTAQAKLIGNSVSSSGSVESSGGGSSGPVILGDPDVQSGLFKALCWLAFGIGGFCLVFFGVPKAYDEIVYAFSPKNSANWEYSIRGKFGLATLLTSKDGNDKLDTYVGNSASLEKVYKSVYGNTFSQTDYVKIVDEACKKDTKCADIPFNKLRSLAIANKNLDSFDTKTAFALSNYWNSIDKTKKYNYEFGRHGCDTKRDVCDGNNLYTYKYVYRNKLEEMK